MSINSLRVPASLLVALIAALLVASGLARTRKLYAPDGSPLTQAQSEARNPLNQGVAAFKNGQ
jgi:hypothetical protein